MHELIQKMIESPDSAPEVAIELNDLITGYESTVTSSAESIEAANKRIKELQETNQRLFLRVSSGSVTQPTEPVDEMSPWEKAVEKAGYDPAQLLDKRGI